tara:strand:+ start:3282 stop:4040 length:759 start_codon:yes stop_codon:yes gene_type:complete
MSNPRESVYTGKQLLEVAQETVESTSTTTSGHGRSSNAIWKKYISTALKNSTLSPFVYKEVLRSLISTFNNFYYVNGNDELVKIKAIHSAPERAVAKKFQEDNIVLPILTVHQVGAANDVAKRRYNDILIQKSTWDDDKQRAQRIIGTADVPVVLTFSVNLWTKYMEDLDQVSQNIRMKFNPSLAVSTEFTSSLKVYLQDETSNVTIQTGDREDRILRKSFSTQVEFFIPSPKFLVTSTGRIEKIVSNIWVS